MTELETYLQSVKDRASKYNIEHDDFPDELFELAHTDVPKLLEIIDMLLNVQDADLEYLDMDKVNKIVRGES